MPLGKSHKFLNKSEMRARALDNWRPSQKYLNGKPLALAAMPESDYLRYEYHLMMFGPMADYDGIEKWCKDTISGEYRLDGPMWIMMGYAHYHIHLMDANSAMLLKLRWI
jgi:hypothetical protein